MMDDEDENGGEAERPAGAAPPNPRENTILIGQEAAEAAFLQAYDRGRLSHAWLLAGPSGIGKATLAYRIARFLLAESGGSEGGGLFATPAPRSLALPASDPAFRQIASGGHPDLLVVERSFDAKRKRQRREILADEVRSVADFLHLTSGRGGWRVVIIDGADLMNIHAANGLLKILEEPPKRALLLLVSDNPGRLLPTIRSRCRILALKPLPDAVLRQLLEQYRPDLTAHDRQLILVLAEGSIGRACALAAEGGIDIYRRISSLLEDLPKVNYEAVHALADELARNGADDDFGLFAELLPAWLARLVALQAGHAAASSGEERIMRRLAARGLDQWVEVWEKLTDLFAQAEGINLDRKQVVLNAFFALEDAAR